MGAMVLVSLDVAVAAAKQVADRVMSLVYEGKQRPMSCCVACCPHAIEANARSTQGESCLFALWWLYRARAYRCRPCCFLDKNRCSY